MTEKNSSTIGPLKDLIRDRRDLAEGTTWYLFGSQLRADAGSRDIDVLVVYPNGGLAAAHELAELVRGLDYFPHYEVLALSKTEELDLAFTSSEGAQEFWPR